MLGENVKVHFSGNEGTLDFWYLPLKTAGVNYRFWSCYRKIKDLKDRSKLKRPDRDHKIPESAFKHTILSPGLYSMIFGYDRGNGADKAALSEYLDKYIEFVKVNRLEATCMEFNVQKILGVKAAWEFREKLRLELPNRQMNVFHLEDGMDGLKALTDFSDYIAFDLTELKKERKRSYRADLRALVEFAKNRKPEIDIHLLACTDLQVLRENNTCTSADSTRWTVAQRFHRLPILGEPRLERIKPEVYQSYQDRLMARARADGIKVRDLRRSVTLAISADLSKKEYARHAGGQD